MSTNTAFSNGLPSSNNNNENVQPFFVHCHGCNQPFDTSKSTVFPKCECTDGFLLYAISGCAKPSVLEKK